MITFTKAVPEWRMASGRQQQHNASSVALATVNFKLNFAFVSLSAEN